MNFQQKKYKSVTFLLSPDM